MKIEAAEMGERVATEALVRELVRNDARRGEGMAKVVFAGRCLFGG